MSLFTQTVRTINLGVSLAVSGVHETKHGVIHNSVVAVPLQARSVTVC